MGNSISFKEQQDNYLISGDAFNAIIDKSTGLISSYAVNDVEVITDGMQFNFWRALTDNDKGWKVDKKMGVWKEEGSNYTLQKIGVTKAKENTVEVASMYLFNSTGTTGLITQTFYTDGTIAFDIQFSIPSSAPNVPRIGFHLKLNKSMQQVSWYGRGPHENYIDRLTSAPIGMYKSTVEEWVTPYVKPQENANRCDIRWIRFGNSDTGMTFESAGDDFLSVSAWPYDQETLAQAQHDFELPSGNDIIVNIDHQQMGVGGDNSWGQPVMEKYQIKPRQFQYKFILKAEK